MKPKTTYSPCTSCGHPTRAAGGKCDPCSRNVPVPEPDPKFWSTPYLIRCAEELAGRRDAIDAALQKASAA